MSAQPTAAAAGTMDVGGDLTVNRLGFGAMRITGRGIWGQPPSREQAINTLRRVVELGVNFIDTADSYGPSVSEELIAEALYPYPDDLVIATKGGLVRPAPNRWEADGHPEHLREVCEGSLRRLRLEQIPLYQFHRPDPAVRGGPDQASLGRDHQVVRVRVQRLGDQFLAHRRSVGVCRVDEVDPQLDHPPQRRDSLPPAGWLAPDPAAGNAHRAEPQAVDGQVTADIDGPRRCGGWLCAHSEPPLLRFQRQPLTIPARHRSGAEQGLVAYPPDQQVRRLSSPGPEPI